MRSGKLSRMVASAIVVLLLLLLIGCKASQGQKEKAKTQTTVEKKGASLSEQAKQHFVQGHKFLKKKELEAAIKEFAEAVRLSPEAALGHYWLGMAYYYNHQPEKAIPEFKKVIELEPDNFRGYAMLGKMYSLNRNTLDQAVEALKKAISINAEYPEAHYDLGRIYAVRGERDKGLAEFAFIFRMEPRFAYYHFEAGRIFEAMKAYDRAKGEYRKALALDPRLKRAREALEKLEKKEGTK